MRQYERWQKIISILSARRHVTTQELAEEFGVEKRTIQKDICTLSAGYPIYTKPGIHGGVFIKDSYRPYNNTLTTTELDVLMRVRSKTEGNDRGVLSQIIQKYGPVKAGI